MKKLTKKFIKELLEPVLNGGKIVDIDIYQEGKQADVIAISKHHIPEKYTIRLQYNRVVTFYSLLDTNETMFDDYFMSTYLF